MKNLFALTLFILLLWLTNNPAQDITTVIIVRHAEKQIPAEDPDNTNMMKHDVNLTEAGEQRAVKLAEMLNRSGVTAVFSTNTTRTKETVNNYADIQGLQIIIYDDTNKLADNIRSNYRGNKILVSAHSNTIGPLMTALGTDSVPEINSDYYDGFFVVTLTVDGKTSWLHLEY